MSEPQEPSVLRGVDGHLGVITLNRPETLNALTLEMIGLIDEALGQFQDDPAVTTVLLEGAGDRAFCAGGDIRALYEAARSDHAFAKDFWQQEYRLNARIAGYPKPVVAFMDRIVMGGGIGLTGHASHRVVTERSVIAMPEVAIGFVPDVGGTWLLSHTPGELGTHVALTAGRIGAADAILTDIADRHVLSDDLAELRDALTQAAPDEVIARFATEPPPGALADAREWIDEAYASDDPAEIVDRLVDSGDDLDKAAVAISSHSPTAVAVTLQALRNARNLPTLERCLEAEYRVSTAFLDHPDFVEGVRALIIDKDRSPQWTPDDLAEVTPERLAPFFEGSDEFQIDPPETL